ncbi:sulfite oxidase, mitochondrial-like protein, partial [Euroglyphus maynei]
HHTQQVYDILESYRIGNLREEDYLKPDQNDLDLMDFIPERDQSLLIHHDKPFNAETPGEILIQNFNTPNEKFFIRNHLSVPRVDAEDYVLEIEGFGLNGSFEFTLEQLKTLFPKHTVTSVIQCGGNRRDDLNKFKQVKGIGWKLGAIGNTRWSG